MQPAIAFEIESLEMKLQDTECEYERQYLEQKLRLLYDIHEEMQYANSEQ